MMRIAGACHCGTLRFALDWPDDAATIPARGCDVQTAPCLVQKEQPQARAGIVAASSGQSSANRNVPQWQAPPMRIISVPVA